MSPPISIRSKVVVCALALMVGALWAVLHVLEGGVGSAQTLPSQAQDAAGPGSEPQALQQIESASERAMAADLELEAAGTDESSIAVPDGNRPELAGRIVVEDGSDLPALVRVAAWPGSRGLPRRQTLSELEADPAVLIAVVEPDGSFVVEGAVPGVDYELAAGGSGWVGLELASCTPGEAGLELVIERLYGHAFEVTDDAGPVQLNPGYFGRGSGRLEVPAAYAGANPIDWDFPGPALNAALSPAIERTRRHPLEYVVALATAPTSKGGDAFASLDGVFMEFDLPGYAKKRATCALRPVEGGLLASALRLQVTGEGFGGVVLRGLGDACDPERDIEAHLQLQSSGARMAMFSVATARRTSDGALWWGGVPAGDYWAGFIWDYSGKGLDLRSQRGSGASKGVVVPGGGTCELWVSGDDYAAVDLTVTRGGKPYLGALTVRVDPGLRMGAMRTMSRAPYHLGYVPTGPLKILIRDPLSEGDMGPPSVDVVTRPGETVRATIVY